MSGAVMVLSTGKPTLRASVLPTGLAAVRFGPGTAVTLQTAVVTVVGGTLPYTYLWTRVSGDADIGAIDGTSSSTKFAAYHSGLGSYEAVFKCVVTDGAAASVDSNHITVTTEAN